MRQVIANCLLTEKIYESANSEVYRGIRESDGQSFILKVLKQDYPSSQELTRYKQEYEIICNLDLNGVIKAYGLEPYQRTLVIVLEDFGASSLKELMHQASLSINVGKMGEHLEDFLRLAIKISDTLGQIHAANIIHKDINPSNIVLNPETNKVKIIDFGLSTILTRENPTLKNPNVLEGTLAYISPEQTGRMNRALDYRTDFYSLGVTFYELLTGQLPFLTADAMELVHCQIAKQPVPLDELLETQGNVSPPTIISNIVMKLMAKTAEERYQSAWGLKADLEECLRQWQIMGTIKPFSLGSLDISDRFQIPQKLYGREAEIQTLLTTFERVAAGRDNSEAHKPSGTLTKTVTRSHTPIEMMLVAGYSGIGKSALVREIHKPITAMRGYFIAGKFDQFQRNIPYSALVAAFQALIQQLLTENPTELKQWREKLLGVLGTNAQVIIDVIPEVELIIGKQPAVPALGPTESQNRFNLVFGNFLRIFCAPEHPLVIFLDDLQWVDSATLRLLELIVTDNDTQYLFLIGAYRDNEVSPAHPLMMTLEELQKQAIVINQITLTALTIDCVSQLLAETLKCDRRSVQALAELVMHKTRGNPFFVNQFLKTLHLENLLTFDFHRPGWQWDMVQIEAMDITDNVVDLTISKVKKLPDPTQQVLRLAACIGASFDLTTLAIINEQSTTEIFQHLLPAVQSGLILTKSDLDSQLLIQKYQFSHDRIQQAAYALIGEEKKQIIHLQIGRLLLQNLSAQERLERQFEVVDHLNLGQGLMTNDLEKRELAKLNLDAGRKAKDSIAYAAAQQYLSLGIEYLSKDRWRDDYELTFQLYQEKSEIEYLNGNYEQSERLTNLLLENAQSPIEKADTYNFLILLYTVLGKYSDAIEAGRKALKLLGIDLPSENWLEALNLELIEATKNLGDRQISSLVNEPEMSDPDKKIAVKLLMRLNTPAYFFDENLFALICTKCSNLSFKYGPAPSSGLGYGSYATILLKRLTNYQSAYELALLGTKVSDRFNDLANKCKAHLMLANHLIQWVKPSKFAQPINEEGYKAGLESGDIQFAGYILHYQVCNKFFEGERLEDILALIPDYLQFATKPKNIITYHTLLGHQLGIFNLSGKTSDMLSFDNNEITEAQYLDNCQRDQDYYSLCLYYILKSQILYHHAQYHLVLEYSELAQKLLPFILGVVAEAEHNFYSSLSLAALFPESTSQEKQSYWAKLETNQEQMKIWADNCPENFLHKYLLVEAEIARIQGEDLAAIDLYDHAITSAAENEFIQNEALGNELAAKFWLGRGKVEFARLYLKKAHHSYQLWGARRKVADLENQYPQLLSRILDMPKAGIQTTISMPSDSSERHTSALDLTSVFKASQVLAGEIVLDKLLTKLMQILIENAGAQKGFLMLKENNIWLIEAEGTANEEDVITLQSIPVNSVNSTQSPLLSTAIINYVAHTQENVVLNDANHEGQFMSDPYVVSRSPKSVLCAPLLNQGQLNGIVYLENNLTTGAFTPERVEIIRILSAQAAISIENSRLYSQLAEYSRTLEQKVEERTKALQSTNQELERLVNLDGLTQVANRRYFDHYLAQEWQRMARNQQPLSLVLFDVDFFKQFNDCYGHQAGDDCLIQVAQAAKRAVKRPADLLARYGGEEFVIVLPNTDIKGAIVISQRIQDELRQLQIVHEKSEVSPVVTLSIGVTCQIPSPPTTANRLISEADEALYLAKQQGRNQYCLSSSVASM